MMRYMELHGGRRPVGMRPEVRHQPRGPDQGMWLRRLEGRALRSVIRCRMAAGATAVAAPLSRKSGRTWGQRTTSPARSPPDTRARCSFFHVSDERGDVFEMYRRAQMHWPIRLLAPRSRTSHRRRTSSSAVSSAGRIFGSGTTRASMTCRSARSGTGWLPRRSGWGTWGAPPAWATTTTHEDSPHIPARNILRWCGASGVGICGPDFQDCGAPTRSVLI